MTVPRILLSTLALVLLAAADLRADELLLTNGDRLTGTAVTMAEGELTYQTAYAGRLTIPWREVAGLSTAEPVRVVLADGTTWTGVAEAPGDGALGLAAEAGAEPRTVALAEVAALNPPVRPRVSYRGNVQVGLASTRGNSDTASTHLAGELTVRAGRGRYTLDAALNRTEDRGEATSSNTTLSAEYDRFYGERWYLNASLLAAEDEFKDLELRTAVGIGVGYQVLDTDRTSLAAELGVSQVEQDFIATPDESFAAGRWSLRFERLLAGQRVRAFHTQEGFVGLASTDGGELLLRTRTGLRFSLLRSFVASTQLNLDYDRSPSPGREKRDTALLVNLGLQW